MNARERWQALQARLTAARTFAEAGDRKSALKEIDAALALDPNFLAAHSLRERVLSEPAPTPAPVTPAAVRPAAAVPADGYAQFEQRARRRRVDRKVEAARTAIARRRLKDAAAALDEIIELDANMPELAALTAQFDDLRRHTHTAPRGPWIVAAASFAAIVLGATWLEHARPSLASHPTTVVAGLLATPSQASVATDVPVPVNAPPPAPTVEPAPTATATTPPAPAGTTGVLPLSASGGPDPSTSPASARATPRGNPVEGREGVPERPPVVEHERPLRAADVRTEPPPRSADSRDSAVSETRVPPTAPVPMETSPLPPMPVRAASEPMTIAPVPLPLPNTASTVSPGNVVRTANDEQLVKQALQRYRRAYEGLDAPSARAVYPAVNEAALARAFDGLESQTLTFDDCEVELHGDSASATCRGTARYVPKVGSREPRTEPRRWTFALRRAGNDWKIDNARAER